MNRIHNTLAIGFFIAAFFIVLSLATDDQGITGFAAREDTCKDGTPLYECSESSLGNACELTRSGPMLLFSEKCYE